MKDQAHRPTDDPDIGLLEFCGFVVCAFGIVVGLWAVAVFYLVSFGA